MNREDRFIGQISEQIDEVLIEVDPFGFIMAGAPRNEYSEYVAPILDLLKSAAESEKSDISKELYGIFEKSCGRGFTSSVPAADWKDMSDRLLVVWKNRRTEIEG